MRTGFAAQHNSSFSPVGMLMHLCSFFRFCFHSHFRHFNPESVTVCTLHSKHFHGSWFLFLRYLFFSSFLISISHKIKLNERQTTNGVHQCVGVPLEKITINWKWKWKRECIQCSPLTICTALAIQNECILTETWHQWGRLLFFVGWQSVTVTERKNQCKTVPWERRSQISHLKILNWKACAKPFSNICVFIRNGAQSAHKWLTK